VRSCFLETANRKVEGVGHREADDKFGGRGHGNVTEVDCWYGKMTAEMTPVDRVHLNQGAKILGLSRKYILSVTCPQ
jgi:hypothetical protein